LKSSDSMPAIILIDTQLAENIGTTARAMLNCGLTDLRLVRPREAWPNDKAVAASSGADVVLEKARLFDTTKEAVADLRRLYAATARHRDMNMPVVAPGDAAAAMRAFAAQGEACGVLFGPERSGLVNDDIALAGEIIHFSLNPVHQSLNLAQAVLLVAYEWHMAGETAPIVKKGRKATSEAASKADLIRFFEHLEAELDDSGFLRPPEKRASMVLNIRNLFQRANLSETEVRTLRGIVNSLVIYGGSGGPDKAKGRKPSKRATKKGD